MMNLFRQWFGTSPARRPARQANLRLESLEGRAVPAGNVTAYLSGGDLVVSGDNAGNYVRVTQEGAGQYRVQGFYWDGSATTVNNQSSDVISGVYDDIRIYANGGRDNVVVGNYDYTGAINVDVPDRLYINLGQGEGNYLQSANVRNVRTGGDLALYGNSGRDSFQVQFADVGRDLRIDSNDGADILSVLNSSIGDDFDVDTDGGNDNVTLSNLTVADDFDLNTGSDNDSVGLNGKILVNGSLKVDLGSGDDGLGIYGYVQAREDAIFDGGSGRADDLNFGSNGEVASVYGNLAFINFEK